MLNDLEATIQKIITDAAAGMAKKIAQTVRQSIATSIMGNGAGTAAAPTGKRRGRPPGAGAKQKVAAAPAKPPTRKPARGKRSAGAAADGDLATVHAYVAAHPGERSEQIQRGIGGDSALIKAALATLTANGRLKRAGYGRGGSYTAAGAKAAATAAPAPTAKTGKAKGKKAKAPRGVRTYTDADLARAIEVIAAKPGLLPSQYQAQSGIDKKVWDNAIFKLKSDGKIKVTGKARNTSYTVA